jgi:hypothetical protein
LRSDQDDGPSLFDAAPTLAEMKAWIKAAKAEPDDIEELEAAF